MSSRIACFLRRSLLFTFRPRDSRRMSESQGLHSRQAEAYARHRPKYPPDLFDFILRFCPRPLSLAWDVGTGNGQAAVQLSRSFPRVVATDVSEAQILRAEKRPNIEYAATVATPSEQQLENLLGPTGSVDLVTSATAYHWMDFDWFELAVRRVLRPGGVVAVWSYFRDSVTPRVDQVLKDFIKAVRPYMSPVVRYAIDEYRDIPFPFKPHPENLDSGTGPFFFEAKREASLEDYLGFLGSWSPVQTAREQGVHILSEGMKERMKAAWGEPSDLHVVTTRIFLRIGVA